MQNFNEKFKTDLFQRCKKFSLDVLRLIDQLPNKRSLNVVANQLARSATSIGANMIEGRAASSRLELKKFNEIALKSANETKYWLEILQEANLAPPAVMNSIMKELSELSSMIASGILKLKSKL